MRNLATLIIAALLTGCGYTTAALRVVEYSGGGIVAPVTGAAAGIAVHQAGSEHAFARVTIIYRGERAEVRISTKRAEGEAD